MSRDKEANPAAGASIKAMAADLYGITFDEAAAARVAADLARLESAAAAAGTPAPGAAPGGLFRRLLLAGAPGTGGRS